MRITPLVLTGALAMAGFAGEATAAPKKKPISKSYQATAGAVDPSNWADSDPYSVCAQNVPGSFHTHDFKAPAAGKIKIEMTNFTGDWDLLFVDPKDSEVAAGGGSDLGTPGTPTTEVATAKIKKAGTYKIIACNWVGGPTADVKYTFTYA